MVDGKNKNDGKSPAKEASKELKPLITMNRHVKVNNAMQQAKINVKQQELNAKDNSWHQGNPNGKANSVNEHQRRVSNEKTQPSPNVEDDSLDANVDESNASLSTIFNMDSKNNSNTCATATEGLDSNKFVSTICSIRTNPAPDTGINQGGMPQSKNECKSATNHDYQALANFRSNTDNVTFILLEIMALLIIITVDRLFMP